MIGNVGVERGTIASRPILACIGKVTSTLPKTTYVVYYRNHMHEDEQLYKNIDQLREVLLPNRQLLLKVVNFEIGEEKVIENTNFKCEDGKVSISYKYLEYSVVLEGRVLNQSQSQEGLVNLSLLEKRGYDEFYKYRKKYKTLQNITRKIEFQIDHRIRLVVAGKEYQFDLEEKKKEHYFFNLPAFQQPVTIILEETTSVEDFIQVDKVQEVEADLSHLCEGESSYNAKVKFGNKFQVTFLFNLIKNQNLSSADFVSIRVLETSGKAPWIKVSTPQTIHLSECPKVQPLIGGRFFDWQWGYLNENLAQIEGSIYDYLPKLTPSVPKYAHFANQQMIDLRSSNFLVLQVGDTPITVPVAYILKGFNFVECQQYSVKFYVDSSRLDAGIEGKNKRKKVYQMNIGEIWNIGKINRLLDKSNVNEFYLKIINQDTYYYIPFQRRAVSSNEFRKEIKELATRSQVVQLSDGRFCSLQPHPKGKDQLILMEATCLNPFYLITSTSSSPLSFQLLIGNAISLEGSLSREKIQVQAGKAVVHLLTSIDGSTKVGLVLSFTDISQSAGSANSCFRFAHRLSFAEPGETEEVTYDIEIEFDKESKIKPLRSKLSPVVRRQTFQSVILRQLSGGAGILRKEEWVSFTLRLRKMHFNQQMNYFDNEILMTKEIAVNPTPEQLTSGKTYLAVRVEKESFEGLEFDLYDLNIKKRMKYYLEIYMEKNEFLDHKDSSYKFKVPPLLWKLSNSPPNTNFQLATHLNRRSRNTSKSSLQSGQSQDITLDHYNYNDGVSLVESGTGTTAYSKFLRAIKIKCDILKDKIGWNAQGEWFFGVLCFPQANFYFLAQRVFDPYEDKKKGASSSRSHKTVSREASSRSDKHKVDPLAKTVSNLDLFKLKQRRNELIAEGRQLTARYVKRQEKIVELTKRISELDESLKKKESQQGEMKVDRKRQKKENVKMKEFYRSICECGAMNPQFNGYCDACLKKLKQSYEAYARQYKEKCYQYQKMVFEGYNQKDKIQKLKRKIHNMKTLKVQVEVEDQNPQLLLKDMEEKNLKKAIQELQVEIFDMEEEKNSLVGTSNWQMAALEQKIAKEDGLIYKASQEYDSLKNKLADLIRMEKDQSQSSSQDN